MTTSLKLVTVMKLMWADNPHIAEIISLKDALQLITTDFLQTDSAHKADVLITVLSYLWKTRTEVNDISSLEELVKLVKRPDDKFENGFPYDKDDMRYVCNDSQDKTYYSVSKLHTNGNYHTIRNAYLKATLVDNGDDGIGNEASPLEIQYGGCRSSL